LLVTSTAQHAARPALRLRGGVSYTYGQVGAAAVDVAGRLREQGIGPGDRVVLFAENSPQWGITYLSITGMGAVVVPLLTDFHPDQVARILEHVEPSLIVVSESTTAAVSQFTPPAPVRQLADLVPVPDAPAAPDPVGEIFDYRPGAEDLAAIIYTSGTTGMPKGVMLSHGNLVSNVLNTSAMVPLYDEDRLLSILPLAHTYECTIGFLIPFFAGASVTYLSGPPVISTLLPALSEVRPTMMLSVPLIMEKIYHSRVAPVIGKLPGFLRGFPPVRKLIHRIAAGKVKRLFGGSLRFFGIGGAALSEDTERFLREGGFPYAIGYGLTETSPLIAGADAKHTHFRSGGHAVPNTELRIYREVDEADAAVTTAAPKRAAKETLGEIQVRGPGVMQGYYRNPEATAAAFTEDGWLKTGDLGTIDKKGYVFIRGRSKTTIIGPSGENIFPEEIEAAINADEVVEESLVVPEQGTLVARVRVNVEKLAERLGDALPSVDLESARGHAEAFLDDLRKRVNSRLNRFSRVSKMKLQDEPFERTPTKKIKRFRYHQDG
jgi:long-chain acyl-CoA synthetase